jgi:hypothetical protein
MAEQRGKRTDSLDSGRLAPAPPPPPGTTINPPYNDFPLELGGSFHEVITVTVPKGIKFVKLVATGNTKEFVVSITPAAGKSLLGDKEEPVTFEVDFQGVKPCADIEQIFEGHLEVVGSDEKVLAQKRVRITVPPCRSEIYSYSVKFVCGVQEDCKCEEGPVRPGMYATEINIYNDGDRETKVEKHVVPIVFAGAAAGREPGIARSKASDSILLPPRSATMDDCRRLGELLFGAHPTSPLPLTLGFLELVSSEPLQVVAVYTATGLQGGPVSIEVETVQPRRKRKTTTTHPIPVAGPH